MYIEYIELLKVNGCYNCRYMIYEYFMYYCFCSFCNIGSCNIGFREKCVWGLNKKILELYIIKKKLN